ncbi:MAG: amidohydrolase family protein [Planctomycetota bacterium]|jgi:cytosine/adenosine deaminase-related metal-dependent hydrolase|nr:amidohydrolase family protein [Planctomycetota bacterium]MDP6762342.1 amidohydrolase family protein [Planctomycetota bacterium]MDP6989733.1 amidohydrolase family protein [Planctomycetota bacterium]
MSGSEADSVRAGGWVNAHTHLYSALVPLGMPAPSPSPRGLSEVLRAIWWRLDRALDPDCLRAAARLYVAESLLSGTTALVDHHESPEFIEGSLDLLADACEDLGMRALLCYGATERNGGRTEARRGLEECRRFHASNRRTLVRGAVGLHASFTVSDETIREAGALARELGTVVHVHVAEGVEDVDHARERGHADPLARLLACEGLPEGSILAHAVHLDESSLRRAAERGLWIVQNPRSNRANEVGYPRALWAGGRVALGTDGFPSDPLEEGEALLRESALHGEGGPAVAERLQAGTALLAGLPAPLPAARVERGRLLQGEREVVRDGGLAACDLDQVRAEASEQAHRLWRRMEAIA